MHYKVPEISRRAFLAMAASHAICAQQQPGTGKDPTFSANVKIVSVLATVRDKQGKIVSNLNKEDFDLAEDGRPQVIRYFARETDLPLTLGLLADTSFSQRAVLGQERDASYRFVEKVLREDRDKAFVIHFDREVELLQDLTSSRTALEKALNGLQVSQQDRPQLNRSGGGGQGGGYPGGGYPGGSGRYPRDGGGGRGFGRGTTLYDAVLLASDELMKKQQGRKALVVMSDGVDRGSKVPLAQAIESAQKADTLVYSILFTSQEENQQRPGGFAGRGMGRRAGMGRHPQTQQRERPDGRKILEQISRETGGAFFEVSKKLSIDQVYERIEEELRNEYSLGYSSDRTEPDGEFRKISVSAKPKGLVVQAREGYYAR